MYKSYEHKRRNIIALRRNVEWSYGRVFNALTFKQYQKVPVGVTYKQKIEFIMKNVSKSKKIQALCEHALMDWNQWQKAIKSPVLSFKVIQGERLIKGYSKANLRLVG